MRCMRCRQDNADGARFCGQCGARLDSACGACGAANAATSKFCQECGVPLVAAAPTLKFASPETYTPGHLAKKILIARSELAGERKQVTVLFADLKGSLELLADRDPEDARALLDAVLERLIEAVHRFEGTVNQVMGDGIMALFGAPVAHEDHAVRACYAALRMHRAIDRYAEEVRRGQGLDVQIRVGINSGEVVVRSIGSDLQMDYTAVGQTTHLAARMEQLARPGVTLITDATRRLADRHIVAESQGPVPVKGLKDPVEVYELRAAAPANSRLQTVTARALTRFMGRDTEMERLHRLLEAAAGGDGQVVALVGEPGVGKSRLVGEFVQSSATQGWDVLEVSAVAYDASTPYLPITTLLKAYFRVDATDDPARVQDKVSARLMDLGLPLAEMLPPLLALGNLPVGDPDWIAADPPERRRRLFSAITQLMRRASRVRPLLLVVENVQWGDSETRAVLASLADALRDARAMLVLSHRSEFHLGWMPRPGLTEVRLEPLAPETADALLRGLLGDAPDLAPVKALLVERTDGNPLFLEESVQSLVETGVISGERADYHLAKPLDAIRIPDRVQALVAARIDRLPREDKACLQAGAVIGKDVHFAVLQAVADQPADVLMREIADLEAGEFLRPSSLFPELAYSFKHAVTHDVVYSSLLKDQRRTLHARIVDALETLYPERRADYVERLAHHAIGGELWYEAVGYLREAAAKAVARSANREAVAFLEQALLALRHLPESSETFLHAIDVRLDLRPPLLQLGRLDAIRAVSSEAASMAAQIADEGRLARAYTYLINYHYLLGEPERVLDYGARCLAITERSADDTFATLARRYMGHCYHALGQLGRTVRVLEDNVAALENARDDTEDLVSYVASCAWLAWAHADEGDFDTAERWIDRARARAENRRHPYSQAIASAFAGLVAAGRGQLERAVPLLSHSLDICRQAQLAVWQPVPSAVLGLCLVLADRKAEGLALLEDGVRQSERLGVKAYLARWTTHLGEGLLVAGDVRRARAVAERALELARTHGERGHEAAARRLLGDVAALGDPDDPDRAAVHYGAALRLAEELGMRPLQARTHLAVGQLLRRRGELPEAEEHIARAMVLFSDLGMRFWLERAEPELRALGHLVIVARDNADLFEFLAAKFKEDAGVRVILDRRHVAPGDGVAATGRAESDRRRQSLDARLRARGLAVVIQP
jgi:class 3 adenylate cyclase/tetratricopeptide (TPR) repeat protein